MKKSLVVNGHDRSLRKRWHYVCCNSCEVYKCRYQIKTAEKDGYAALQIGFEEKKESKVNAAERGHFAKANVKATKVLAEIKGDELAGYQLGDKISADLFKAGEVVDVIGTSKGRGYCGTIKRWGHKIGPKGNGSGYHRGQGSFANNGRNNARVIPGKKMFWSSR